MFVDGVHSQSNIGRLVIAGPSRISVNNLEIERLSAKSEEIERAS